MTILPDLIQLTRALKKQKVLFDLVFCLVPQFLWAQTPIPFTLKNNSTFDDSQIYVALVGQDLNADRTHIWVDLSTGETKPMNTQFNTLKGPEISGNLGPGGQGLYAQCFSKLSDISQKKFNLAGIQGARLFISVKKPLYLYFFGSTGAQRGYAGPDANNPTDPNTGILYENIELTYDQYGIWGNTSRVDAYHYPMGLELKAQNGSSQKAGEILNHEQITQLFLKWAPAEFLNNYDTQSGEIRQPTKTPDFADGTIGTMPNKGPYADYMKPYIDQIWEKYRHEDLLFKTSEAGTWKGRVSGDSLIFVALDGGFTGRKGIISRKPTTQEAFEGKGVLDHEVQDRTTDLLVQAQICAALSRHAINTETPNVGLQDFSNASLYYQKAPANFYSAFWHLPQVSYNQKSYGFAYDDVFDQSSTLHTPSPTEVILHFGGFAPSQVSELDISPVKTESSRLFLWQNHHLSTALTPSQSLAIFDSKGNLIVKTTQKELALEYLPKGSYFLQIHEENSKAVYLGRILIGL